MSRPALATPGRKAQTFKTAAIALAVVALATMAADPAMAQTDVFQSASTKLATAFQSTRTISMIIAGFGMVAIASMAYFGRFNFKHLAGLIGGLILISCASGVISYVTSGSSVGGTAVSFDGSSMGDTFAK